MKIMKPALDWRQASGRLKTHAYVPGLLHDLHAASRPSCLRS